jgi:hypothetical protein
MVVAVDGSGIEIWPVFSVFNYAEDVGTIGVCVISGRRGLG